MQETEKDIYLEIFGLGNLLSVLFEDYFRYIMPVLVILVIAIKFLPDWLERFNLAPVGASDGGTGVAPWLKSCREFLLKYFNGRAAVFILQMALLPAIIIVLIWTACLNISLFVSVFIVTAVLGGGLAAMKYREIKEEERFKKKGGYRRKRIRFFGKSALNEGSHRNFYLDMLGIGIFITFFKPDWFYWIMLGTLVLLVIVRLAEMAAEFYSEVDFERYMDRKMREEELKRKGETEGAAPSPPSRF